MHGFEKSALVIPISGPELAVGERPLTLRPAS
jgi:hypothetical protein